MNESVRETFSEMIGNWNRMQASDMDDAGDDADRFQRSFYEFVDELKVWFESRTQRPQSVDAAMALPEVEALLDELPGPLHLNLETELELIVEGLNREDDAVYD